jgi:hypothetical protein
MSIRLFLDRDWGSVLSYVVDSVVREINDNIITDNNDCSNLLFIRKDPLSSVSDFEYVSNPSVHKILHITLTFQSNGGLEIRNETRFDLAIPMHIDIHVIRIGDIEEAQVVAKMLVQAVNDFFSAENPKKAFPKIPKIPHCPSIVTDNSTLPPLRNSDGLTDFPTKGENKDINFRNSKFAMFPFDLTMRIIEEIPEVWCKGGNQFGNRAFDYWIKVMKALHENKPIPNECQRWLKKREGYIARHRKDNRMAGIIAMIKWAGFVDGPGARAKGCEDGSSLDFMLDVIGYNKRIK